MKPNYRLLMLVALLATALTVVGCSDDDDPSSPGTESEFAGYLDWDQVEYTNAPSPFLGPAHQASDPNYSRSIYTNALAKSAIEGDYPVGSTFVKEVFTFDGDGNKTLADPMGLLGMIKRGDGFDTEGNNWEFFNIDPGDLSTIASGADLGACKGCHAAAVNDNGNDRIFHHPYEFIATNSDFDDYASWSLIGTEQGPDPLLGAAHEGNDADAVRKVYKKQLQARPGDGQWDSYPVGTMLLKTVQDQGGDIIGKTGMVKRGAGFDADNGDWEYFMWDVASGDIAVQGAVGMCIGCHGGANVNDNGADYVFAHPDDPFNNNNP